jgi:hypothetical protein
VRRRRRRLTVYAVAAVALAAMHSIAVAGKGGSGKGGSGKGGSGKGGSGKDADSASISQNESTPALGTWVTFSSSYPTSTKNARIQV